jgi:molybdopterin converting factor small subunit
MTIEIKIQSTGWISAALGLSEPGTATLVKKLEEGASLQELFSSLAGEYPQFAEKVYNPAAAELSPQLIVILNHKMVRLKEFSQTILKKSDQIALTPILSGG